MSARKPLVAGNWKMHRTPAEAVRLASTVARSVGAPDDVEVVLCPAFPALAAVAEVLEGKGPQLGAQNVHQEDEGAFTGEVSAPMLRESGCRYVIVGHSERRALFGETDDVVHRKAAAVLRHGMGAIVCVGETLEQREAGQTESVVVGQVRGALRAIDDLLHVVVAYEPVWAIGTGRTASADQAQETHALIRRTVRTMAGGEAAAGLRILYGGSVKPANAAELFACPDVDGGLIGGASLDAKSFGRIVDASRAG